LPLAAAQLEMVQGFGTDHLIGFIALC